MEYILWNCSDRVPLDCMSMEEREAAPMKFIPGEDDHMILEIDELDSSSGEV